MIAMTTPLRLHDPVELIARAGLIDIDVTVFYYAFLFILLMFVLPGLVFKPMLARIDQREARTVGARQEAMLFAKSTTAGAAQFEVASAAAKHKALDERAKLREETRTRADEMVASARRETLARIDAGLAAQQAQVAEARLALATDAREIAHAIAQKLVQA